jgi:hypothetical protein
MATKKPPTTTKAKSPGARPSARATPKDPQAVRALVLSDPNTAKIAEKLGVPLEDYVREVVHFVLNPKADASLYVVEDDDLRTAGFEPPDADAIGRFITEAAAVSSAADATEWTDPRGKKPVDLDGPRGAPEVPDKTDPKLKKDLDRALRAKRGGKG